MFTLAMMTFLAVVGGGIYAIKLYLESQDTTVQEVRYEQQMPKVDFSTIQKDLESGALQKKQEEEKIKSYVLDVIKNGSSDHGYPMGNMPPQMARGENAVAIAGYVSRGLASAQPAAFGVCIACHGSDGRGDPGMAPSLIDLPIYHHQREKVSNAVLSPKEETVISAITKQEKSGFEKTIDTIVANINIYASTVGQDGVSKEALEDFVIGEISSYTQEQRSSCLSQLITITKSLVDYGKSYEDAKKSSKKPEIEVIDWISVIKYFTVQFHQTIDKENQKAEEARDSYNQQLSAKQSKATEAQLELIVTLQEIGAALLAFILLTMMLVLIKIEKNTRNCGGNKENEEN